MQNCERSKNRAGRDCINGNLGNGEKRDKIAMGKSWNILFMGSHGKKQQFTHIGIECQCGAAKKGTNNVLCNIRTKTSNTRTTTTTTQNGTFGAHIVTQYTCER